MVALALSVGGGGGVFGSAEQGSEVDLCGCDVFAEARCAERVESEPAGVVLCCGHPLAQ